LRRNDFESSKIKSIILTVGRRSPPPSGVPQITVKVIDPSHSPTGWGFFISNQVTLKALKRLFLVYSANSFSTRRRVRGATTRIVGNATIQLFSQAVTQVLAKLSTNPVVFKTETPETTQDMKIERKKLKASWEYFFGIIENPEK
jgi:hypothetical protein